MALFGPYNTEKNQINVQLKQANEVIRAERFTLGELLLQKMDEGMEITDPDILAVYGKIQDERGKIRDLNSRYEELEEKIRREQEEREAEVQRRKEEAQRLKEARAAEQSAVRQRAARMNTCPACGNTVIEGALFCNRCGQKLLKPENAAPAYCAVCGAKLTEGAKFCGGCGAKLTD